MTYSTAVGQNAIYNQFKNASTTVDVKIQQIDSLLESNLEKSEFEYFSKVSYRYAWWLHSKKKFHKSISILRKSIQFHKGSTLSLQKKHHRLGLYLDNNGQNQEGLEAWNQVISLNGKNEFIARAHVKTAENLSAKGDYYSSKIYFERAEALYKHLKNYELLVKTYNKSYKVYKNIKTKESRKKLLSNLIKSDSLCVNEKIKYLTKYNSKRFFGLFYADYQNRNIELGRDKFNQVLDLAIKAKDTFGIAYVYRDIALLYDDTDPEKSISYLNLSLNYFKENSQKAITYSNLGLNNAHLKKTNLSIDQQHNALHYLTGNDFKNIDRKQEQEILHKYYNDRNLWIILSNIAETYLVSYEINKQEDHLKKSIEYFRITDDLIDIFNENIEEVQSKLLWRKNASEIYSRALKASFLAKDYTSAFRFMEKNKSLILYEENAERKRKFTSQLPNYLIDRESYLKKRIRNSTNNSEIINSKKQLDRFHDSIKEAFPLYSYKLKKYTPKPFDKIQSELTENQVVLEYHVTVDSGYGIYPNKNKAYGILITKNKKHFFEIQHMDSLKLKIEKHLALSSIPLISNQEKESYKKVAYEIFTKLFPIEIREFIKGKELIIIPDNYLSKISFEGLVTSNNNERSDYLIFQNQISYQYSHTFHDKIKNNQQASTNQNLTAFAPVDFHEQKLVALPNSIEEVENINSYFNGKIYTNKNATKQAFLNSLKNSNIIHLATHANANDSIAPWIAFSDGKISLDELSLHENNTSLTVLSACNTSIGKIKDGEGTMSLSRGFFYGSTQTSVSSLWVADDKATASIMNDFYKNLSQGQSKGMALHNSKLNYLNNHYGSELSPYYWSSFILIGDTSPLPQRSSLLLYIFGLITLVFVFVKLKRKKAS